MNIKQTLKKWFTVTTADQDKDFLGNYTLTTFGLGVLFALNIAYIAPVNALAFWCWMVSIIIVLAYSFLMADKCVVVSK